MRHLFNSLIPHIVIRTQLIIISQATGIFKAFYDADLIDEEVILEWGKKVSKKYVSKELSEKIHKKCEPFLTWLKEAEEEESDESDEEVEIGFDERAKISSMKEQVLTWVFASVPIPHPKYRSCTGTAHLQA